MGTRLALHSILCELLGCPESGKECRCYFKPPPSVMMRYPCIRYERSRIESRFADDNPYLFQKRYTVTVIDENPDSDIPDKVAALARCSHERRYVSENLNHDVFNLYF